MPLWPGNYNELNLITVKNHAEHNCHASRIEMGMHTATHIDFPLHHIENGKTSSDYPLSRFNGKASVINCFSKQDEFNHKKIESYIDKDCPDILILRSRNKEIKSDKLDLNFPVLDQKSIDLFVKFAIKMIGVDNVSVDQFGKEPVNHKKLLTNDILILEGLNLSSTTEGLCTIHCYPISFQKTEAAPCRALIEL